MKVFSGLVVIVLMLPACNNDQEVPGTDTDTVIENNSNTNINDTTAGAKPVNPESEPGVDKLIIPGERIGKTELNSDADSLEILLGKPDVSDAAMGKAWLTWFGKKPDEHNNKTQLDIYTAYKDTSMRKKTVQQIRVTSSYFITAGDIHVYSALNEVRMAFPQINKVAQYKDEGRNIVIYDDTQQGIAFEIAVADTQHICTGIIIHTKGKRVTDIYIMQHPGMQKF